MSKYPSVITDSILEQNKYISDDEIKADIEDTLAEISIEEAKAEANEVIFNKSSNQAERKMAAFRRDAARDAIQRRQEFVQFLELLLAARQPNNACT
ncbi:MAG TPA: hypothetical protein VMW24_09060 [Sedimentisphaerales bacterium]|nr:hypothetical protein [Sedimentisphaerales bacterium]